MSLLQVDVLLYIMLFYLNLRLVFYMFRWCGPCKLLGPRLEALVGAHNGDVILAKVDIDDMPDLAMDHGVSELLKFI